MKKELKKTGQKIVIILMLLPASLVALAAGHTGVTDTPSLSSFKGIEISASVTLVLLSVILLSAKGPARIDH